MTKTSSGAPAIGTWIRWATAFLIGLATVAAAAFGWRAAQIGSTAAFDDRQSISETVSVEQGRIERSITVANAAREYGRYRADYAVAAALDRDAARLTRGGALRPARISRAEAAALRAGATRRAVAAGAFGRATIGTSLLRPAVRPRPFDYGARERALAAEESASLDSPGNLDPDRWARAAHDIRVRVNGLIRWAFVALLAVLLYTVAEVAARPRVVYAFLGAGLVVYLAGVVGGLTTVFF